MTTDNVLEGVVLEETPPVEQPFNEAQEAKLQQMITDATNLAEQRGFDKGSREMQGKKDKEVAVLDRRAKRAEGRLAGYEGSFKNLDEETQKDVELQQLRTERYNYSLAEQEEQAKEMMYQTIGTFEANMTEHVKDLGLDPTDKRIDWGDRDNANLNERSKQVLASVRKIQKENAKVEKDAMEQRFKDMELKLRVDLGIESHDTTTSAGVESSSDKAFEKKMADPDYVATAEDFKRAKKILNK